MYHQTIVPKKNELLDQPTHPKKAHAKHEGAAQWRRNKIFGKQKTKNGDAAKEIDQSQIRNLQNRTR